MNVRDRIKQRIHDHGRIPFEQFMDMALYCSDLGYYTRKGSNIGREGDFYTSPHMHPVFGMVMARQLEECWELLGKPKSFTAVEQGAGKGYLALDILDHLKNRELYKNLNYVIIEINPHVAAHQKSLLAQHMELVRWIDDINTMDLFTGCYVSNELPDAFPVHLVQMDDSLKEVFVGLDHDGFIEALATPSTPEIDDYFRKFSVAPGTGYRTEVNLRIKNWLNSVAARLTEGFVVTVDYGYSAQEYYSEERSRGTLMCYYQHQVNENPYQHIGEQDITAHVNFSSLKVWGEEYGLQTRGYCPQGPYLVSMGLDEIISEKYLTDEHYQFEVAKIKNLILPTGMGESHKVMVQYKGTRDFVLKGFSIRNKVHIL